MIKAENLEKWFGHHKVVDNVSLTVEKGEVLGFLGPNGAGKSTTMRMITGFLPMDGGRISVCGHDMDQDPIAAKQAIGYLPENAPAYGDMTVEGFLKFIASMRGFSGAKARTAVAEAIATCYLEPVRHQTVETLSKGYLHRACFAQSLLHDPDVLIFDEPTDGLDPNQKHEMRGLIKRMGERKAIIISTHILEEVHAVCSRVVIINQGKLVANGLPDELRSCAKNAGSVILAVRGGSRDTMTGKLKGLDQVKDVLCERDADGVCTMRVIPRGGDARDGLAARVSALAVREGWVMEELRTDPGRLDEVFREITSSDGSTDGATKGGAK